MNTSSGTSRAETADRPREPLPSRVAAAHPRDHALDVLHLVADVPLDRELVRRARSPSGSSPAARPGPRAPARRPRSPAAKLTLRAHSVRSTEKAAPTWKRNSPAGTTPSSRSPRGTRAVRLDRVVDARPRVPAHLGSSSRTLKIGVSYAWRGMPVGDAVASTSSNAGSRLHQPLALVAYLRRPRPRFAVRKRERRDRRRTPTPARNAASVESAGRLPTSSSSLSRVRSCPLLSV